MMRAMSTGPLPRQADVRKLASSGAVLEGTVKVAELARLAQALQADDGLVAFRLCFGISEEGHPSIIGEVSSRVTVRCERCLEPMALDIASSFELGVVYSDEQAKQLPGRLDPLLLEQETVDTRTVVEDEVLLCLPLVSYHSRQDCTREIGYESRPEGEEPVQEDRNNPFDVLATLKKPKS